MNVIHSIIAILLIIITCSCEQQPAAPANNLKSTAEIEPGEKQLIKTEPAAVKALPNDVQHYLSTYCYDCHNEDKQKGDRRLDIVNADFDNRENLILLEEVLDQLNLGEMPPEKKNVKQPSDDETKKMVEWLTATLIKVESKHQKQATVMRRLNHFEYKNTMRDLLALDNNAFDPTRHFQADKREEGFDKVGEAMVLSDFQLKQYLHAADAYISEELSLATILFLFRYNIISTFSLIFSSPSTTSQL